jgi:hypothetical protein
MKEKRKRRLIQRLKNEERVKAKSQTNSALKAKKQIKQGK